MDKIIKNYEEPISKPPTTRDFIKYLKHKREVKKTFKKQKQADGCGHDHSKENIRDIPKNIDIMSFAVIVDNIVVEVMNVQDFFGKFLEQNPKFVLIKENEHRPHVGWLYKDNNFIPFEQHINEIRPTTRG